MPSRQSLRRASSSRSEISFICAAKAARPASRSACCWRRVSDANRSALIDDRHRLGPEHDVGGQCLTSSHGRVVREHLERDLGAVDGCQRRAGGQLDRFGAQRTVGRRRHLPLADGDARAAEVRRCHQRARHADLPAQLAGQERQADDPEAGRPVERVLCERAAQDPAHERRAVDQERRDERLEARDADGVIGPRRDLGERDSPRLHVADREALEAEVKVTPVVLDADADAAVRESLHGVGPGLYVVWALLVVRERQDDRDGRLGARLVEPRAAAAARREHGLATSTQTPRPRTIRMSAGRLMGAMIAHRRATARILTAAFPSRGEPSSAARWETRFRWLPSSRDVQSRNVRDRGWQRNAIALPSGAQAPLSPRMPRRSTRRPVPSGRIVASLAFRGPREPAGQSSAPDAPVVEEDPFAVRGELRIAGARRPVRELVDEPLRAAGDVDGHQLREPLRAVVEIALEHDRRAVRGPGRVAVSLAVRRGSRYLPDPAAVRVHDVDGDLRGLGPPAERAGRTGKRDAPSVGRPCGLAIGPALTVAVGELAEARPVRLDGVEIVAKCRRCACARTGRGTRPATSAGRSRRGSAATW